MTLQSSPPSEEYTKYEVLLRELYHIENVKRGLQNMIELNDTLNKPLDNPDIKVIHVAGTNGKGSVALKIAKSLELAGHKVGLLISPHIASYRERMSINGELISEQQVEKYLPEVLGLCSEFHIPATFFEISTGLAFRYFSDSGTDVVVLETGLGGRLDATNVVTTPALCVITSIGLEHTAILGDTVELIAAEKAGIIKKGVPVLVGPNVPHDVIRQCAKDKKAEGYYTCEDILGSTAGCQQIVNGIEYIDYDVENSRTAKAALYLLQKKRRSDAFPSLNLSEEHINHGTSQRPACRFEKVRDCKGGTTILDIAHNPPAMKTLVAKLQASYPNTNKRFVVGFSADKDIADIAKLLLAVVPEPSNIHLVEAVNLRAAKIEAILEAEPKLAKSNFAETDRSIAAQVELGMRLAAQNDEVLVVCGSVFLMAEARQSLGIDEPRDSENITNVAGKGLLKCKEKIMKDADNKTSSSS